MLRKLRLLALFLFCSLQFLALKSVGQKRSIVSNELLNRYPEIGQQWHKQESNNFILLWGNGSGDNPTNASDPNLRFNPSEILDRFESVFATYYHLDAFDKSWNYSINNQKTVVIVNKTYGENIGRQDYAASGKVYNNLVMQLTIPALSSKSVVAHEYAHIIQGGYLEETKGTSGNFFYYLGIGFLEAHANFLASLVTPDDFVKNEHMQGIDFYNSNIPTEWKNAYNAFPFLSAIYSQEGLDIINKIWIHSNISEEPLATYKRLKGFSQQQFNNFMFDIYAKKMVNLDFNYIGHYLRTGRNNNRLDLKTMQRLYTIPRKLSGNQYLVAMDQAPEEYGYNIIPLHYQGSETVTIKFKGHPEVNDHAGWRYGFVSVGPGSSYVNFSQTFESNEQTISYPINTTDKTYLVVMGAPKNYVTTNTSNDTKHGFPKHFRFPYELTISGALPEGHKVTSWETRFPMDFRIHSNGGGKVDMNCSVPPSVYVAPHAIVFGGARIEGQVRIENSAIVKGGYIKDRVVIKDKAVVIQSTLSGNARVEGSAFVENSTLSESAIAMERAEIHSVNLYGNAVTSGDLRVIGGTCGSGVYRNNYSLYGSNSLSCDQRNADHPENIDVNRPLQINPTFINTANISGYLIQNVQTGQFLTLHTEVNQLLIQQQSNSNEQFFQIATINGDPNSLSIKLSRQSGYSYGRDRYLHSGNTNFDEIITFQEGNPQGWAFEPVSGKTDTYVIRSRRSGLTLFFHNSGNPWLRQWGSDGQSDERFQWRLIPVPDVGTYKLRNIATGKILDVLGGFTAPGAEVGTYDDFDGANQRFKLVKSDQVGNVVNRFMISPSHTKDRRFLSVNGGNYNPDGTTVSIYVKSDPTEQWDFEYSYSASSGNPVYLVKSAYEFGQKYIGDVYDRARIYNWGGIQGDSRFQWELIPAKTEYYVNEGTYKIRSIDNTSHVWAVPGASLSNWTGLITFNGPEYDDQKFEVKIDENTLNYNILPSYSFGRLSIDIPGGTGVGGTQAITYAFNANARNHQWDIRSEAPGAPFTIRNIASNSFLYRQAEDNGVKQFPNVLDSRFYWSFEPTSPAQQRILPGWYVLKNVETNRVLDVRDRSSNAGAELITWDWWGTDNQIFHVNIRDGFYTIQPSYLSNWFLSVASGANFGDPIVLWPDDFRVQKFDFLIRGNTNDQFKYPIVGIQTANNSQRLDVFLNTNNNRVEQWGHGPYAATDKRFQWVMIPLGNSNGRIAANKVGGLEMVAIQDTTKSSPETVLSGSQVGLNVFPNPAVDDINVEITDFDPTDLLTLTVTDAMGNLLFEKTIGTSRKIKIESNLFRTSNQIYLIHVNNGDRKITKKVIYEENGK